MDWVRWAALDQTKRERDALAVTAAASVARPVTPPAEDTPIPTTPVRQMIPPGQPRKTPTGKRVALEMLGDGHESDDDSNGIIPMDLKTESGDLDEEAPVTKQSRTLSPSGQTVMKTATAVAGSPTKQQRALTARGPPATATKPVRASPRILNAANARRMGVELGATVSQASGTPAASLRSSRRVKEEPAPMTRSRSGTQTQRTSRPTPSKIPSRKLSRPGSPPTLPSRGKTIPTAIPSGGSSSRLPTLIPGKRALAGKSLSTASALPTVQNQGLPSVAEGAPMILNRGTPTPVEEEKGKEDAWMSGADAMAAVEPGTKPGSRPSIQRARRRRSSFSSIDINV